MLGTDAQAYQAGGNPAEQRKFLEESQRQGEMADGRLTGQGGVDETFVGEHLGRLGHSGWKFAAGLDLIEMFVDGAAIA